MPKPKVFISRILPDIGMEMLHQIAEIEVWPERISTGVK